VLPDDLIKGGRTLTKGEKICVLVLFVRSPLYVSICRSSFFFVRTRFSSSVVPFEDSLSERRPSLFPDGDEDAKVFSLSLSVPLFFPSAVFSPASHALALSLLLPCVRFVFSPSCYTYNYLTT